MIPCLLILEGPTVTHRVRIISFSMLEPSTYTCRFQDETGRVLIASGCLVSYLGDLDALPPCPRPDGLSPAEAHTRKEAGPKAGGNP